MIFFALPRSARMLPTHIVTHLQYTLKAEKPRPVDQMFAFSCLLDISMPSDGVAADA